MTIENEWLKNVITLMTIVSCIGAAVSGYYAFIAGRLSKGAIAYQFFIRYSDEKMRQALIKMGNFEKEYKEKHKEEFINFWHEALINKEVWAVELEEARHIIKYFYRDIATLYQSHCMKYETAKKICSAGGVFLFTGCIIPMEEKANGYPYKNEYHPIPKIADKMLIIRNKYKQELKHPIYRVFPPLLVLRRKLLP
jgi:hypothetical protein